MLSHKPRIPADLDEHLTDIVKNIRNSNDVHWLSVVMWSHTGKFYGQDRRYMTLENTKANLLRDRNWHSVHCMAQVRFRFAAKNQKLTDQQMIGGMVADIKNIMDAVPGIPHNHEPELRWRPWRIALLMKKPLCNLKLSIQGTAKLIASDEATVVKADPLVVEVLEELIMEEEGCFSHDPRVWSAPEYGDV